MDSHSKGAGAWIWLARALFAILGATSSLSAPAQGLEALGERATIGQPMQVQLRLRDPDAAIGLPLRDCLRAEMRQGDNQAAAMPLLLTQAAREPDGSLRVTLSDTAPVHEPLLFVRAHWTCGASFVREFTLLAEPPGATAETPTPPASTTASAPALAATTTGTAAPGITPNTAPGPVSSPAPSSALLAPVGMAAPAAELAGRPQAERAPTGATRSTVRFTRSTAQSTAQVTAQSTAQPHRQAIGRPIAQAPARQVVQPAVAIASSTPVTAATNPARVSAEVVPSATEALRLIWQQDLAALRDEQRLSRAQLARLGARLESAERENTQAWWVAAVASLGLVGTVIVTRAAPRESASRRLARSRLAGWWRRWRSRQRHAATLAGPVGVVEAPTGRSERSGRTEPAVTWPEPAAPQPGLPTQVAADPVSFGPDSRRLDADPSQAVLDDSRHLDLIHKIDRLAADGYVGASVTVLENARRGRVGKSPGILLRLLDRYGQLGQAANRERVSAELAAIYNVRVPPEVGADEGPPLEACGRLWSELLEAWPTSRAVSVLDGALLRPGLHAPLSLAALREAVDLRGVAAIRDAMGPTELPPITLLAPEDAAEPSAWTLAPVSG